MVMSDKCGKEVNENGLMVSLDKLTHILPYLSIEECPWVQVTVRSTIHNPYSLFVRFTILVDYRQ